MILFILLNWAWALDPKIVETWPECQGRKSQWSSNYIGHLKDGRRFFVPTDQLNLFSRHIQKLNEWNQKQTTCNKHLSTSAGGLNSPPHPSVILVDDIQKNMISKIQKELSVQKNIIKNGIICTSSKPPVNIQKKCDEYLETLIPEMNKRLKYMRALKSLAARGQSLEHDKPFTNDLYQTFYPSIWKENSIHKLSPLTSDELKLRNDLAKKINPEQALEAYYSLISTTPALLFFDDQVNKENLHTALSNLNEQNQMDQSEILKNPPQELFMMVDYVREAIREIPESRRGDACLVVSEIYKNLKIQYETLPVYLAIVFGVSSLSSAPLKLFGKQFLEGRLKKMALSGSAVFSSMNFKNFQTYQRGVAFCSSQVISDDMLKSKICNAQGLNTIYDNLQTGVVVSTGIFVGMGTLSLLRMAKNLIKQ